MNKKLPLIEGLSGCSCKLTAHELSELLKSAAFDVESKDRRVLAGIGEDAAVYELDEGRALVSSIDFFTPVVEDPYAQGWISVNNACNDLFAKGVVDVSCIQAVVALPIELEVSVGGDILKGMGDYARQIGSGISGGHTILNPWCITGAAVGGIALKKNLVYNSSARPKDTLVLTKPLGVKVAIEANMKFPEEEETRKIMERARSIMMEPGRKAAQAMNEVGVNAATDITGFGLLGHAKQVAHRSGVDIVFDSLPVIAGTPNLSGRLGIDLSGGRCSETAGGILISVSEEKVEELVSALKERSVGCFAVGEVVEGSGSVRFSGELEVKEV